MKESTSFHQDERNKAYFQNIMQFLVNDSLEINLGIFTERGFLKLSNVKQHYLDKGEFILPCFKWKSLIINSCSDYNLLEIQFPGMIGKEVVDFDISRYCEIELIKNIWKKVSRDSNEKTYDSLGKAFEPCFIIKDIFYDNVGYIIYKIVLIACKEGKIGFSRIDESISNISNAFNIGISIIVKEPCHSILNEVKKNCLIYDRKNMVQCRVGDILIFYFTKQN